MDIYPIFAALKRQKTAAILIALEIALCCAIICNALFLIANRLQRMQIASGVAENELIHIRTAGAGGSDADAMAKLKADVAALSGLPGVRGVSVVNQVPFGSSSWNTSVRLAQDDRNSVANVGSYYGDERLLETLGVSLVAGREFNDDEFVDFDQLVSSEGHEPNVAIITRTMARVLYGDADPLGKVFFPGDTPTRVIGVVDRLLRPRIDEGETVAETSMILPVRLGEGYGNFLLRADPAQRDAVIESARALLREREPNRLIVKAQTVEQLRENYFKQDRVMAGLLVAVVASLLIVTALGIVGLASFWVQRRRRQIGVRRALGATRAQILRYFQTENFLIVTVGIVIGMLAAYAISGWLMRHYALPPLPLFYLPVGAAVLWLLGQVAVLAPALRAASVPPATATRSV
jgi:putative ABC transport system permease protein